MKAAGSESHEVRRSILACQSGFAESVHPFCEVVAGLQCTIHLCRSHALVLRQIFGVLPLEEFDPVLGHGLTSKMAISRRLLVLGLPKSQRHGDCTWTAIKLDLDDVAIWTQPPQLSAL